MVGLGDLTIDEVKDRLTRTIHDSVVPIPAFRVECVELDGLLVAIVEVGPGADKPYALSGNPPAFFAKTRLQLVSCYPGGDPRLDDFTFPSRSLRHALTPPPARPQMPRHRIRPRRSPGSRAFCDQFFAYYSHFWHRRSQRPKMPTAAG